MGMVIERIVNKLYASMVYDCTARAYIMRGGLSVCVCVRIRGGFFFQEGYSC